MEFTTRHEFDCAAATFFSEAVYFHPEYHERLHRELHFRAVEIVERQEDGDRLREVRIKRLEREFPAAMRRAMGVDHIEYREEAEYDRKKLAYDFKVIPNVAPDKIHIGGCYRILPAGPNRCIREVDMTVEVRVFGIGGMIERHLVDDLRRSYDDAAAFTRRWIAERVPPGGP
jgi:hypothetical protein